MSVLSTSIGTLSISGNHRGITRIDFRLTKKKTAPGTSLEERCRKQIDEYFKGQRKKFSLPIDLNSSPFQLSVLKAIQDIPFGQTRTYAEIAQAIGKPLAVRVVGNACGANPLPIIIPCHRVVRSKGSGSGIGVGGYSGGIKRKQWLLEHEKEPEKGKREKGKRAKRKEDKMYDDLLPFCRRCSSSLRGSDASVVSRSNNLSPPLLTTHSPP